MNEPFKWPEPRWLSEITDERQQDQERIRFYLSLAALYCSPDGSLRALSEACGKKGDTMRVSRWRAAVGPKVAIRIEGVLGRPLFPRELFRPDLFALED